MAQEATQEEVLEAARSLGEDEFTRKDVADKLGAEVSAMQPSWKAAKQAGRLEKVRDDGDKRYFRLVEN
jgi:DNA-binding MarR family transcriptional regulator